MEEEKLAENAERMGRIIKQEFSTLNSEIVAAVRGRGLFWAIVVKDTPGLIKALWPSLGGSELKSNQTKKSPPSAIIKDNI